MPSTSFNGRKFYLDKTTGYWKTAIRRGPREYLHRAVYIAVHGEIPDGWHVHHKDDDRANNAAENLEAMPMKAHVHGVHKRTTVAICEQCGTEYVHHNKAPSRWCSAKCAWTWHNPRRYGKWQQASQTTSL